MESVSWNGMDMSHQGYAKELSNELALEAAFNRPLSPVEVQLLWCTFGINYSCNHRPFFSGSTPGRWCWL